MWFAIPSCSGYICVGFLWLSTSQFVDIQQFYWYSLNSSSVPLLFRIIQSLSEVLLGCGSCLISSGSRFHFSTVLTEKENFLASVSDPDPDWTRIQTGQWISIRIQEGKNDPRK
jgi:hypothetical protein